MLLFNLINLLISNAVAININKSILYSRTVLLSLLSISIVTINNINIKPLSTGLGLYNGLFNTSLLNQSFTLFILLITIAICSLTAFYPRKDYYYKSSKELPGQENNIPKEEDNRLHETGKSSFHVKLYEIMHEYTNKIKNMYKPEEYNEKNLALIINKNASQFCILEYSLIILFVLCGSILLINTGDLVALFLAIELQSYGLYIISSIYRDSESATNSALTYFLLGGLSSCLILLGSAILYVNSGNTNLDCIFLVNSIDEFSYSEHHGNREGLYALNLLYDSLNVYETNYINFSLIILTVGLLFKISAAPFHFWSPDVYDGIPTVVTTFVAVIGKISILLIMLEIVSYSDISVTYETLESVYKSDKMGLNYEWKNIIILSSIMSLFIGSILGLTQYRIKKLLAYSTISHIGFILLALCINKIESVQAYIFYILQYSLSNLNAFFILIVMGYTLYEFVNKPTNKNTKTKDPDIYIDIENSPMQLLSQIKGYFYVNSFLSISFAITLFSFVGIPPLIGFFAKQMVLSAALDQGYVFIALVAIITSVVSAAYYLNLINLIFFTKSTYIKRDLIKDISDKSELNSNRLITINDRLATIISIFTMLIVLFVITPDEWLRIVNILSLSISKY